MSSTPTSCSRKMLLIYSVITRINNLCNIDHNMQPFLCIVGSLSIFCWPHCVYNLQCRTLTCNEELTHSGVCLWLKTNMWMLLPPLLPTCISWKCPFKRWFQRDCGKRRTCREGIIREIWEIKKTSSQKAQDWGNRTLSKKYFCLCWGTSWQHVCIVSPAYSTDTASYYVPMLICPSIFCLLLNIFLMKQGDVIRGSIAETKWYFQRPVVNFKFWNDSI